LLAGPIPGNGLWGGFGGLCETENRGDPIVLFDRLADRWLLSQFAFATDANDNPIGPCFQCIVISTSPDPTGTYFRYGTPNFFSSFSQSPTQQLNIWQIHVDFRTPANSTFGLNGQPNVTLATAPFNTNFGLLCRRFRLCIRQPGTFLRLDAISDRLMYRLQYRYFGSFQTLVSNHTMAGGGSQTAFIPHNRWGDYSMLAVDPTDDCTFWYTQEYHATTSNADWQTRIGAFKFPACGAP
jgi:hypothetical protein